MINSKMSKFQNLPSELLQQIASHLPVSVQVSLKLTSKHFFNRIPGPPLHSINYLLQCEKKALTRVKDEFELLNAGLRYCVLCDKVQGSECFSREDLPICDSHDRWFFKTSEQFSNLGRSPTDKAWILSRNIGKPLWVAEPRLYCAHNRMIVHWADRKCRCECESCGHFDVMCHTRICSHGELPLSWVLWKDESGRVCVEEKHAGCKSAVAQQPPRIADNKTANLLRRYVNVPVVDISVFEKK